MPLDIQQIRKQFPALSLIDDGKPRTYLDNPAGTQIPQSVIHRMTDYMVNSNANAGGHFRTSKESNGLIIEAHHAMADLLNAPSPEEIIFGPNMTTLTFGISRSIAHWFTPGDEIIVTKMDHDANIAPWLMIASDSGLEIKWLSFDKQTYRYDLKELEKLLTGRVRLVAINYASNAIGTINDLKTISAMVHAAGAYLFVDAVHYLPHGPTDVQALDCDFLTCSVYKFFGCHQGVLWGRQELFEKLPAYKVRPASENPPGKFETGTQSHEGQVGTIGAVDYLAWLGKTMATEYHTQYADLSGRRRYLHAAMSSIKDYEKRLSAHLISGLRNIPGVAIHGITDLDSLDERVPTVSFTMNGFHPSEIAERLAAKNIFVWDGDYYAVEVVKHLGIQDKGGMLRVGAVHYNTIEEINQLIAVLAEMKSR